MAVMLGGVILFTGAETASDYEVGSKILNVVMGYVRNLRRRPAAPSKGRGPVQVRIKRAFAATGAEVLSSTVIYDWTHARCLATGVLCLADTAAQSAQPQ
jgi:hypothetical protein